MCYVVPAPQQNDNGRIIGVERNAGQVADSDGEIHRMPDLALLETKPKRHQRGLAKKRKGSRRRARQRMRVQRAQRRLANCCFPEYLGRSRPFCTGLFRLRILVDRD